MSTRSQIPMRDQSAGRFGKPAIALSVATVSLLILTGQAFAQDCDTDQDPIEYDSSDGAEPNLVADVSQAWQTLCGGTQGVDFASITDGILTIDDIQTGSRASYCRSSMFRTDCDGEQEAVYEFMTKVLSTDPPSGWDPALAFICGMRDVENDFRVAVTEDEGVGFFNSSLSPTNWLVYNSLEQHVAVTWNEPHLFRIEKDADEVRLYMDNEDDPSLTVPRGSLVNNDPANRADLAVTSTPGRAKFELNMFRYRVGTTDLDAGTRNCAADFNDDDVVDLADLLRLLKVWGDCEDCEEDLDDDDVVGLSDLLILLAAWGSCP